MSHDHYKNLIKTKYDSPTCEHSDDELAEIFEVVTEENAIEYFRHCLPEEGYSPSGICMLSLEGIKGESFSGGAPGEFLLPYGYLVIASSVGGNATVICGRTGKVYWADHCSYSSYYVSYEDKALDKWVDLDYSQENVLKALVPLADDIWKFLDGVLSGEMEEMLDKLD